MINSYFPRYMDVSPFSVAVSDWKCEKNKIALLFFVL